MLCLSESDIMAAVSVFEVMENIESAMYLYEKKEFSMPPRIHLDYDENTLLIMPCSTGEGFGTKLVTVFPKNVNIKAPVTNGIMVLNHAETGAPLALIDGKTLTALRTGAVGGTSIRHLARENAGTLGIIGAGAQGFYQAVFACAAREISDIYIYDRLPEKIHAFGEKLAEVPGNIRIHSAIDAEELVNCSDVVITATTSLEPVLPDKKELLSGKHFVGIGSFKPAMREYPEALFRLVSRVFIDTDHAIEETGDIAVPLREKWISRSQVQTLGKFLMENKGKNSFQGETTFFKSVGMALFDLCLSQLIYRKAKEKGLGQEINL